MSDFNDGMSRTNSSQAMQSLFSAYAPDEDVEEEEEREKVFKSPDDGEKKEATLEDQFSGSEDEKDKSEDEHEKRPSSKVQRADEDSSTPKKPKVERKVTKLVSYGDVMDDADDDDDADESDTDVVVQSSDGIDFTTTLADEPQHAQGFSTTEDGEVMLPPEPPGKCSRHLQDKVSRMYEKMIGSRMNLNHSIQKKKEFRNPSIYDKLIQFCGIDEKGTNYPPELYDPSIWGPESYYTELAKIQKEEMDKKEKERKDKTKIEFVSGVKKESLKGVPERRSKWDTQQPQTIKGGEVVSQSVTMSASGNKTTVISAVGTLKKSKS